MVRVGMGMQTQQLGILFQHQCNNGPCFLKQTSITEEPALVLKGMTSLSTSTSLVQFPFEGVLSILAVLWLIHTSKSNCNPVAAASGARCGMAHQRVFADTKAQHKLLPKFLFLITQANIQVLMYMK